MNHEREPFSEKVPTPPVERFLTPVKRFLHVESSSGIVLLTCTVVALAFANSPLAEWYSKLWKTAVALEFGSFRLAGELGHLIINDGLMTIFFFVVGLEIKREMVHGELRDPKKAMLPLFAALGGMIVPAAIYLALQWGQEGSRGWAVPMATDIAFVVGFLALFGSRVPFSLKIFLLSLAIVDDLGAVLVIALFYSEQIALNWLGAAALGFGVTYLFNRIGVRSIGVYVLLGIFIWYVILRSGLHPTVAGVLLGILTPASAWIGDETIKEVVANAWNRLRGMENLEESAPADLERLRFLAREATSPLHRLETSLHPWVAFVIMPLFALANAGVPLDVNAIREPVAYSVAAGLIFGKPLGIVGFSSLSIWWGLSKLPEGVNWRLIVGGACLAGIGFTMALFINGLAFDGEDFAVKLSAGKIGTLVGSAISALLGAAILLSVPKREGTASAQ